MLWQNQLNGDSLPWLLEPDDSGAAHLALADLLDKPPSDADFRAAQLRAHRHGPIESVLAAMEAPGYWAKSGPGYGPKYYSTVWSIILLAQLGAKAALDTRIARACAYVLDHALTPGGQFSYSGSPDGSLDCLQGNLCAALLDMGCEDPRLDTAFDWMARSVTGTDLAPASERKAARRYYKYKCGPGFACRANGGLPCAWGAVKVLLAFSKLPHERRTHLIHQAIQQGVEFLFSSDPALAAYPTRNGDEPARAWWLFGFPVFYTADVLQSVEALVNLGYEHDARLANALKLIREKQDARGRWNLEYHYNSKTWVNIGRKNQPNKWVTLRAMRVLKAAS
jgi:hypothetical protein